MEKRLLAVAVGAALLGSGTAVAAPFNSFDPRSMAMGGAGTGVANAATAAFFNPSLLSVTDAKDDFAMELPILGVRAYDPNEFVKSLDNFQKDRTLVDNNNDLVLQTNVSNANMSLTALSNAIATGNQAAIQSAAVKAGADVQALATSTNSLSTGLSSLSNKQLAGELGAATVIGIPSKKVGAAVVFNAWGSVGAVIRYRDANTLTTLAGDMNSFGTALTTLGTCNGGSVPCTMPTSTSSYVGANGQVNFNTDTQLTSSVDIRGLYLKEVGLGLSHEFTIGGETFAFGATPKYVSVTTMDYSANVNSAKQGNANGSDYTNTTGSFNIDLGVSKDFGNAWRLGFVVKNALPKTYDFMQLNGATGLKEKTGEVKMNPQARVGVSYQNSWLTAALDADLTQNNAVGFEDKTRYVAFGTELNAANWAQLRLGYRADTVNSKRSVASAGIGLSPFGVHIDFGVAGNAHEIGAAFQLGVRF